VALDVDAALVAQCDHAVQRLLAGCFLVFDRKSQWPLGPACSTTNSAWTVPPNRSVRDSACSTARSPWSLPSVGTRIRSYI
jgi:hypothetical protein